MRDEVGATTTQLLMEASRRTDESDRELAELGVQLLP